jgi:hypothetical protein
MSAAEEIPALTIADRENPKKGPDVLVLLQRIMEKQSRHYMTG